MKNILVLGAFLGISYLIFGEKTETVTETTPVKQPVKSNDELTVLQ